MTAQPATIPELLSAQVAAQGDWPALGVIVDGQLAWHTWNDLAAALGPWRASLARLGVRPGDRVVQVGANSLGWVLADLAIQTLGAVHVPLHAALAPAQAAALIAHSGAVAALVESPALAEALGPLVPEGTVLQALAEMPLADPGLDPGAAPPDPDALTTILYTSGTTGPPRGVMLSHRNLAANAVAVTEAARPTGDEVRLGLLPLSHIYARTCDLYVWLVHGGRLALAERRETIFRDCQLAAPTAINGVPYFYQKVVDRLRQAGGATDAAALRRALGGAVRRCYCG
ncbi:MAG TPA: AMP-binding protein, partial [Lacipirellulaceae bacterium]|nr:AMP-binding protein [Lacipirellulaceae bacterium]